VSANAFLDTNVLIHAFSVGAKAERAEELLQQRCAIGVQGLNEFANVARRKLGFSWDEIREAIAAICRLCPVVVPIDIDLHASGLALAQRYQLSIFDGLIVAAAMRCNCRTLWSEDMHHGLVVEKQLTVVNPFR
jgi:predicted nucleic acid-binding protein